ncbi:MAG: class I SAM-dependent methyltransferase, partial [Candidatus Altiarchaeota archaeon]|nr:class I SAM-dependent methyltransferase [Candidatus Altiarchaeota archaeon]
MVVKQKLQETSRTPFDVELFGFLRRQLQKDGGGYYSREFVSRGIERAHLSHGPGYNQLHGIDFRSELDAFAKTGDVRLLDVGCALGYFLKDMLEYAATKGYSLDVKGVTLTRKIEVMNPDDNDTTLYEPVLSTNVIKRAHAEKLPFPDNHFHMVVDTQGPWAYYDDISGSRTGANMSKRRLNLLNEYYRVLAHGGKIYIEDMYHDSLSHASETREGSPLAIFLKKQPSAR